MQSAISGRQRRSCQMELCPTGARLKLVYGLVVTMWWLVFVCVRENLSLDCTYRWGRRSEPPQHRPLRRPKSALSLAVNAFYIRQLQIRWWPGTRTGNSLSSIKSSKTWERPTQTLMNYLFQPVVQHFPNDISVFGAASLVIVVLW